MARQKKVVKTKETPKTEKVKEPVSNSSIAETAVTPEVTAVSNSKLSDTVVIALNYPRSITFDVDINGVTEFITINGNATNLRGVDMGILPEAGTYGLTFGVSRKLWEAVKAKYSSMPLFKNGYIFAQSNEKETKAAVADHKGLENGFEAKPLSI